MKNKRETNELLDLIEDAYSYLYFLPLGNINRKLRAALVAEGRLHPHGAFNVATARRRPAVASHAEAPAAVSVRCEV